MVLINENIELRSFLIEKDNLDLKSTYLKWICDVKNIELINSFSLYTKPGMNFIEDSFSRFSGSDCQGFFIYHKDSQKYVGTVKLDRIDLFRRSGEIGIMIGEPSSRGKKIGSDAISLLLDYGFNVLGLDRIWGGTSEYNYAMIQLFQKFLFTQEGRFRSANYIGGKYSDNLYFGLLRNEREDNK